MTAVALHAEVLGQLAAGDLVGPSETLKWKAVAAIEVLRAPEDAAPEDGPFQLISSEAEEILGVALPLLEYGGRAGEGRVATSFQLIAEESSNETHQQRPLALLALHHVLWASVAYCLRHGLLTQLRALAGITVPDPYRSPTTVFTSSDLRHADAFGRSADQTFLSAANWLGSLSLLEQLPLLRDANAVEIALAEADLIAALRMAKGDGRVYFHAIGTGGEGRLRVHLDTPEGAMSLAAIFEESESDLPVVLHRCYANLIGRNEHWREPGRLFPEFDPVRPE